MITVKNQVTFIVSANSSLSINEIKEMIEEAFGKVISISHVGQAANIASQARVVYDNPNNPANSRSPKVPGMVNYQVVVHIDETGQMESLIELKNKKIEEEDQAKTEAELRRDAEIKADNARRAIEAANAAANEASIAAEAAGLTDNVN